MPLWEEFSFEQVHEEMSWDEFAPCKNVEEWVEVLGTRVDDKVSLKNEDEFW